MTCGSVPVPEELKKETSHQSHAALKPQPTNAHADLKLHSWDLKRYFGPTGLTLHFWAHQLNEVEEDEGIVVRI